MEQQVVAVSQVAWQLVAWPLVVLLLVRLRRTTADPRQSVPVLAVALLTAAFALLVVAPEESTWLGHAWFVTFPILCATYPDGRVVPRWLVGPVAVLVAVPLLDVARGGTLSAASWWPWFALAELGLLLAPLHRYRQRGTTEERTAVRWAVLGTVATPVCFVLVVVWFGTVGGPGPWESAAADLALLPLPVCLALGLLRPRLLDVDAALHRGATRLGTATAAAAAYVVVQGAAAATGLDPRRAAWAAATAALLLALPLAPVVRRAAARLVYRGQADAEQALVDLDRALDAQPDATGVPRTFLDQVVAGAFLDGARLLPPDARAAGVLDLVVGADPAGVPGREQLPVTYQGEHLADLVVAPRRGETGLTTRDLGLLVRLCSHGAPALHGAVVVVDLLAARSQLVRAHEEERRRLRRDLHDDLGPTLSGLALGAAALSRRLRDTGTGEGRAPDPELAGLGEDLARDIREAVAATREIAHGLRPPVLDDHGLGAAVRERLRGHDGPPAVELEVPAQRLVLPAAVDLAALRIVTEAVGNVRRHARASRCRVRLQVTPGWLLLTVDDDGRGLPTRVRPGVGLHSMRDRAAELGGELLLDRGELGGLGVTVRLPTTPVGVA